MEREKQKTFFLNWFLREKKIYSKLSSKLHHWSHATGYSFRATILFTIMASSWGFEQKMGFYEIFFKLLNEETSYHESFLTINSISLKYGFHNKSFILNLFWMYLWSVAQFQSSALGGFAAAPTQTGWLEVGNWPDVHSE